MLQFVNIIPSPVTGGGISSLSLYGRRLGWGWFRMYHFQIVWLLTSGLGDIDALDHHRIPGAICLNGWKPGNSLHRFLANGDTTKDGVKAI